MKVRSVQRLLLSEGDDRALQASPSDAALDVVAEAAQAMPISVPVTAPESAPEIPPAAPATVPIAAPAFLPVSRGMVRGDWQAGQAKFADVARVSC